MRKVIYFHGGTVADFEVPDDLFESFAANVPWEVRFDDQQLERAQKLLEAFMAADDRIEAAEGELLAACFVWNYFNTHPKPESVIQGDVVIVDLKGDGGTIEYASVDDLDIVAEN